MGPGPQRDDGDDDDDDDVLQRIRPSLVPMLSIGLLVLVDQLSPKRERGMYD